MSTVKRERRNHVAAPLQLPLGLPEGFALDSSEPLFDPSRHLQIELPTAAHSSEFVKSSFPYNHGAAAARDYSLGYTEPFRLLSDEGVRVLQTIVAKNERFAKSNERIPKCLRGLAYRSRFVRDLTYHPAVTELFSQLAGKPLAPHGMGMNMGHTNFGRKIKASSGAPPVIVDQWHVDSVDFVCVLMLSDLSGTKGGNLEVLHKRGVRDNADFMQSGVSKAMEREHVRSVAYPGAGHCVLMQGSQILHRVSPVIEADQPRISVVTSFMSRNVFDADSTRYHTFAHQDPAAVAPVEFARHQAWRVRGAMDYLIEKAEFGKHGPEELAEVLNDAAASLLKSARLLRGEEDDILEWIDHAKVQSKL